MHNVEWVEVQPFHQLGAFKWKAMKLDYKHADTPQPTPDLTKRVIDQFRAAEVDLRAVAAQASSRCERAIETEPEPEI